MHKHTVWCMKHWLEASLRNTKSTTYAVPAAVSILIISKRSHRKKT